MGLQLVWLKTPSRAQVSELTLLPKISTLNDRRCSQSTVLRLRASGLKYVHDGRVAWTEHNSLHPRNWSLRRKVYDTSVMFCFELLTTLISNTGVCMSWYVDRTIETEWSKSSSAAATYKDWHVSRKQATVIFTTTYLLAQAIGSLVFSTYSESYGRRPLYISSAFIFVVATGVVGLSDQIGGVLFGRIISGMVSSVPTTVLSGSIEDMFDMKARIWAVQFWILHGITGVALAPCYAALIERSLGWFVLAPTEIEIILNVSRRWTYNVASIIIAMNALAICFIRESRPSRILKKHLDAEYPGTRLVPADEDIMPSFRAFLSVGLKKPFVLLCTEPVLLAVTVMSASVYGFAYLLTEALPIIYTGFGYGRIESAMLSLLLAVGAFFALSVRVVDIWLARSREVQGGKLVSYQRLPCAEIMTHTIRCLKISSSASSLLPHFKPLHSGLSHGLYHLMDGRSPPLFQPR